MERLLTGIASEATGVPALREIKCVFKDNAKRSVDLIIPMANGKDIMVDVTGVDPYGKKVRADINRLNDKGERIPPAKPVGTDYQDEVAGCHGCIRKYTEIYERTPRHRLIAGALAFANGERKKRILNRSQYIFRDFVVQTTGKIGDGARGVLVMLARMKRERLGKSRSKEVDAQVRIWARKIAKAITFQDAKHTINYNLKVCRKSLIRELINRTEAMRANAVQNASVRAAMDGVKAAKAIRAAQKAYEAQKAEELRAIRNLAYAARASRFEGADAFVDELEERHPLAEPLSPERLHGV